MGKRIWIGFCYFWAGAVVAGVVWLLRTDGSIRPTLTDFVVILAVALAPALLPPAVLALIRHLRSPSIRN